MTITSLYKGITMEATPSAQPPPPYTHIDALTFRIMSCCRIREAKLDPILTPCRDLSPYKSCGLKKAKWSSSMNESALLLSSLIVLWRSNYQNECWHSPCLQIRDDVETLHLICLSFTFLNVHNAVFKVWLSFGTKTPCLVRDISVFVMVSHISSMRTKLPFVVI